MPRPRRVHQSWWSTPWSTVWSLVFVVWTGAVRPALDGRGRRQTSLWTADVVLMNGPGACVPLALVALLPRVSAASVRVPCPHQAEVTPSPGRTGLRLAGAHARLRGVLGEGGEVEPDRAPDPAPGRPIRRPMARAQRPTRRPAQPVGHARAGLSGRLRHARHLSQCIPSLIARRRVLRRAAPEGSLWRLASQHGYDRARTRLRVVEVEPASRRDAEPKMAESTMRKQEKDYTEQVDQLVPASEARAEVSLFQLAVDDADPGPPTGQKAGQIDGAVEDLVGLEKLTRNVPRSHRSAPGPSADARRTRLPTCPRPPGSYSPSSPSCTKPGARNSCGSRS